MAELPILFVAFFFSAVTWAWANAWLVVPVMAAAWLLLFVPSATWARIRSSITAAFHRTEKPAAVVRSEPARVLVHSR